MRWDEHLVVDALQMVSRKSQCSSEFRRYTTGCFIRRSNISCHWLCEHQHEDNQEHTKHKRWASNCTWLRGGRRNSLPLHRAQAGIGHKINDDFRNPWGLFDYRLSNPNYRNLQLPPSSKCWWSLSDDCGYRSCKLHRDGHIYFPTFQAPEASSNLSDSSR